MVARKQGFRQRGVSLWAGSAGAPKTMLCLCGRTYVFVCVCMFVNTCLSPTGLHLRQRVDPVYMNLCVCVLCLNRFVCVPLVCRGMCFGVREV